ncbi:hypothetical protein [Roseobacter sp. N2S]|uniref:hypothetical protein n=1 Tax=Roseobacter sp. N2S TaxID=2663844 RepID=UPI002865A453|nr:hypothetical protein [Roseobacter sp. N2S]MDR6266541.1 hypothetical protein [Roseobacter sp. N2S]
MAIVSNISTLFRDEAAGGAVPDATRTAARSYTATGTITNLAGDLDTSKYKIASIPSDAILDDRTIFDVENWGFAATRIGTLDDVDALVSATTSAATSQSPVAFGDANHDKELWEVLGLAADPGGNITLYAHGIADAAGAGSMPFRIVWLYR